MSDILSVVIPSYNSSAYIAEALESVLGQGCESTLEILVVDDGSQDNTAEIVTQFPEVHYIQTEHGGAGSARNKGVAAAHGNLVAFLDADDIWSRGKLTLQLSAMRSDPSLDMVFGHVEEFLAPGIQDEETSKLRKYSPGYVPGTLLIKKESFERVGHFDGNWRVGEFVDWYIRSMELNLKAQLLKEVVLKRRIHGNNLGRRERGSLGDYARILKAALDRRKALVTN